MLSGLAWKPQIELYWLGFEKAFSVGNLYQFWMSGFLRMELYRARRESRSNIQYIAGFLL